MDILGLDFGLFKDDSPSSSDSELFQVGPQNKELCDALKVEGEKKNEQPLPPEFGAILRQSPIPKSLYDYFIRFLKDGTLPSNEELCDPKTGVKLLTIWQFKLWATYFLFSPEKNSLVSRKSGLLVIPKEDFESKIKEVHEQTRDKRKRLDCIHLSMKETITKSIYAFGERNFGISEEIVREYVQNCPEPRCTYKIFYAAHKKNREKACVRMKLQSSLKPSPKQNFAKSLKLKYRRLSSKTSPLSSPASSCSPEQMKPMHEFVEDLADDIWKECTGFRKTRVESTVTDTGTHGNNIEEQSRDTDVTAPKSPVISISSTSPNSVASVNIISDVEDKENTPPHKEVDDDDVILVKSEQPSTSRKKRIVLKRLAESKGYTPKWNVVKRPKKIAPKQPGKDDKVNFSIHSMTPSKSYKNLQKKLTFLKLNNRQVLVNKGGVLHFATKLPTPSGSSTSAGTSASNSSTSLENLKTEDGKQTVPIALWPVNLLKTVTTTKDSETDSDAGKTEKKPKTLASEKVEREKKKRTRLILPKAGVTPCVVNLVRTTSAGTRIVTPTISSSPHVTVGKKFIKLGSQTKTDSGSSRIIIRPRGTADTSKNQPTGHGPKNQPGKAKLVSTGKELQTVKAKKSDIRKIVLPNPDGKAQAVKRVLRAKSAAAGRPSHDAAISGRKHGEDEESATDKRIKNNDKEVDILEEPKLEETKEYMERCLKVNESLSKLIQMSAQMGTFIRPASAGNKSAIELLRRSINSAYSVVVNSLAQQTQVLNSVRKEEENLTKKLQPSAPTKA